MGTLLTLRRRRRELGLSQTSLASKVGVHLNTIHRIESGRAVPDLPLAGRIACELGLDIESLFPELLNPNAA